MKFNKFNDEVFYSGDSIIKVRQNDINQLKQFALQTLRKRSRLCTHKDIYSSVHEMLIVHEKDIYIRPHKHMGKSESFHVIEGEADIVTFSDDGVILDLIEMSDYREGKVFYYRISEPIFHTVIIKSEVVVFHETTSGPFCREDMFFAEWSPPENEEEATHQFLENLGNQLTEFKRG
jgi:cupin fold WbuC family metalloprotein